MEFRSTATLRHDGREHGDRGSPTDYSCPIVSSYLPFPSAPSYSPSTGPLAAAVAYRPRLFNDRHAPGRHLPFLLRLPQLVQRPPAPVCPLVRCLPLLLHARAAPLTRAVSAPDSRQSLPRQSRCRSTHVSCTSPSLLRCFCPIVCLTSMPSSRHGASDAVLFPGRTPPRSTTTPAGCRALPPRTAASSPAQTSATLLPSTPPSRNAPARPSTRPGLTRPPRTSRPLVSPARRRRTRTTLTSTLRASSSPPSHPLLPTVLSTVALRSPPSTPTTPLPALASHIPSTAPANLRLASPPTSSLAQTRLPTPTRSLPVLALRRTPRELACTPVR